MLTRSSYIQWLERQIEFLTDQSELLTSDQIAGGITQERCRSVAGALRRDIDDAPLASSGGYDSYKSETVEFLHREFEGLSFP